MDYLIIIILLIVIIVLLSKYKIYNRKKYDLQKSQIEDALKHIYDSENRKTDCTSVSLSGSLSISKEKSAKLVDSLLEKNLINSTGNKISLTENGRKYAIQVVRIHRLWEKYLAEKTSIDEDDWHNIAEKNEHKTSVEDANKIAAQLGNPFLDPHGDPIPNEDGEIIHQETFQLSEIKENSYVKIVHIEDEPIEMYKKLSQKSLFVDSVIKVKSNLNDKIIAEINGKEIQLSLSEANNVNVIYLKNVTELEKNIIPLSSLKIDETATIKYLSNRLRGQQRRRLLDFGIVPNTEITARMKSLNDDPTAYEVRNTLIALRKNQADLIFVKRNEI